MCAAPLRLFYISIRQCLTCWVLELKHSARLLKIHRYPSTEGSLPVCMKTFEELRVMYWKCSLVKCPYSLWCWYLLLHLWPYDLLAMCFLKICLSLTLSLCWPIELFLMFVCSCFFRFFSFFFSIIHWKPKKQTRSWIIWTLQAIAEVREEQKQTMLSNSPELSMGFSGESSCPRLQLLELSKSLTWVTLKCLALCKAFYSHTWENSNLPFSKDFIF